MSQLFRAVLLFAITLTTIMPGGQAAAERREEMAPQCPEAGEPALNCIATGPTQALKVPQDFARSQKELEQVEVQNTQYGESLRIGTFNVQAFSQLFFVSATHDGCCEDIPERER